MEREKEKMMIPVTGFDKPLSKYIRIEEYDKVCRQLDKLRDACEAGCKMLRNIAFIHGYKSNSGVNKVIDRLDAALADTEADDDNS